MSEGYLLCCFGENLYFKCAKRLIQCIRKHDNKRSICILTDNVTSFENIENIILIEFDFKKHLHPNIDHNLPWNKYGLLPKIYQSEYTPFDCTMFFDCDVVLYDDEFLKFWDYYYKSGQDLLIPGESDINNRSPPNWHWGNVNNVMNKVGFNVPQILSSLMVYNTNLKQMIKQNLPTILNNIYNFDCKPFFCGGFPDEIIYSILMGLYKIYPNKEILSVWASNSPHWDSCNKNVE